MAYVLFHRSIVDAAPGRGLCFPDWEEQMSRYFFNRLDGQRDPDLEGIELPSLSHARFEAVSFAADTLKEDSFSLWDGGEVRIEVVDETQTLLFTIVIKSVMEPIKSVA